jgi:hypothetical protein
MVSLETILRKQLITDLVRRAITCPYTGRVLDVRTVVVFNDADSDPALVIAPEAYEAIGKSAAALFALAERGLNVDMNTLYR